MHFKKKPKQLIAQNKTMKKYIYVPTGNEVWLDVAIDLYEKGIAEPVLWFGDDRHYTKAKEVFGEVAISRLDYIFYPERLKGINYKGENSNFFLSVNYLRAKDRCLKMMDRLDIYGTFNRLDREVIFNKLTICMLKKIESGQPEALVFSETPHSHTYYLIYEICLYLDLKIIKFNNWLPAPLVFIQDMKTGERQKKGQFSSNLSKKMEEDISNYVHSFSNQKGNDSYELPAMKIQRLEIQWKNKLIYFIQSGLLASIKEYWFQTRMFFNHYYYPINPYKAGLFGRSRNKRLRSKNLIKEFNKNSETIDLDSKYVYYALHFEPERTTNPDGGEFHDQAVAIAKLRDLVPDNIDIFVKEHPTHFYRPKLSSRGRSPLFYDFISNINGVKLVPQNTSSFELIEKSVFVSTITGTTAFESSIMGKQSLIFGDTWFNGCPNIILWEANLTFEDIMNQEQSSPDEILEFLLLEKDQYTVPGCQNISAQKKFTNYLDENFYKEEFDGVSHLLEEFFEKL